jgi:hypothetical protein
MACRMMTGSYTGNAAIISDQAIVALDVPSARAPPLERMLKVVSWYIQ